MTKPVIPGGSPCVDDHTDQPFYVGTARKLISRKQEMDLADGVGVVGSCWKREHVTR
jgi:hypothetical protein